MYVHIILIIEIKTGALLVNKKIQETGHKKRFNTLISASRKSQADILY